MKRIFVLVLLLVVGFTASAQRRGNNGFTSNTYVAISGGVNGYKNISYGLFDNPNWAVEVSAGKWLLNSVILRAELAGMSAVNPDTTSALYLLGHFDFMWDPVTTFAGASRRRKSAICPFIGFGFVLRPKTYEYNTTSLHTDQPIMGHEPMDQDFCATIGINFEYALSKRIFAFGEAKYFFYPQGFDRNIRTGEAAPNAFGGFSVGEVFDYTSSVFNATVGMKYAINKSSYRRRRSGESRNPEDDWYVGVMGGGNYFNYKNSQALPTRTKMAGGNGEFTIGKYFTSKTSVRLNLGGGVFGMADINVPYFQAHADVLLNAHNLNRFVRRRANNLSPYAGCGVIKRLDDAGTMLVAADAGFLYRRYLNKQSDLVVDFRYTMMPPRFMNDAKPIVDEETGYEHYRVGAIGQNSFSVGLVSLMVGYQYNIRYGNLR